MIKQVNIINDKNDILELELMHPEKSGLLVRSITGIGPEQADIFMDDSGILDGGVINFAKKRSRNIVFDLRYMWYPSVEENRHKTYKFFPLKRMIRIEFILDTRNVYTYGCVEENTPDIFSKNSGCQISVLCPDPNFYSTDESYDEVYFDGLESNITLPLYFEDNKDIIFGILNSNFGYKGFINSGDIESPTIITIKNKPTTVNSITIRNLTRDETMILDFTNIEVATNEIIKISSFPRDKYIRIYNSTMTEYRSGINCLVQDSDWIYLSPGRNNLENDFSNGSNINDFYLTYPLVYEGV